MEKLLSDNIKEEVDQQSLILLPTIDTDIINSLITLNINKKFKINYFEL